MDVASPAPIRYSEGDIQAAILAIKHKDFLSVRQAAITLDVLWLTFFWPGHL